MQGAAHRRDCTPQRLIGHAVENMIAHFLRPERLVALFVAPRPKAFREAVQLMYRDVLLDRLELADRAAELHLSNVRSATGRLSRTFSSRSCRNFRISVIPSLPNFFFHR